MKWEESHGGGLIKVLLWDLFGTEKNNKTICRERSPERDSNLTPFNYMSRALPARPTCLDLMLTISTGKN
jgi:hypothetical protein